MAERVQVLVVEDDHDTREMMAWALSLGGLDVSQAENGIAALRVVERAVPDVIVTDLSMPGLDGISLCHRIRALPSAEQTPIIVVTAHTNRLSDAANAGACAVVPKPYPPDLLAELVEHVAHCGRGCAECKPAPMPTPEKEGASVWMRSR